MSFYNRIYLNIKSINNVRLSLKVARMCDYMRVWVGKSTCPLEGEHSPDITLCMIHECFKQTSSRSERTLIEIQLKVGCCVRTHLTSFTLLRSLRLLLEIFKNTLDENPTKMKRHSGCERQEDLPAVYPITDHVGDDEEGEVDVGGRDADEVDNDPGEEEESL